jgi:hypothetical protein
MRTIRSTLTFDVPFTLNKSIGELPAGTYNVEVGEEEIAGLYVTAYRRVGVLLFVRAAGSTRSVSVDPQQLEAALLRDRQANTTCHGDADECAK